jgi:hypothetical protein
MTSRHIGILEYYQRQSPNNFQIEDDDGSYFPRDLPDLKEVYIPYAEPHIEITDLYEKPQDWYYIRELIDELSMQSYAAYYNGLFFASFMVSANCLELILKYELVRKEILKPGNLEARNCVFSRVVDQANKIGLDKYQERLKIVNKARDGFFHFNANKIAEALIYIQNNLIPTETEINIVDIDGTIFTERSNDSPWNIQEYSENVKWSKIAYFAYILLDEIVNDIYGKSKKRGFLIESLNDYDRKKGK